MVKATRFRRSGAANHWADLAGLVAIVCRPDGRLSYVSDLAKRRLARTDKPPRHWRETGLPCADRGRILALGRRLRQDRSSPQGYDVQADDGTRWSLCPTPWGRAGETLVLLNDVTSHHALLERFTRLQADKAVWAAELQHRVHNSLHVLSAMLPMEGIAKPAQGGLERVQGRILALAQAHDGIDVRDGVAVVDLGACIRALHGVVCETRRHEPKTWPLTLHLDDQDATVPVDLAVPIALIVHEILDATGGGAGVTVSLVRQQDRTILETTGICLDEDRFDLGYVGKLVRQLHGDFSLLAAGGLRLVFVPPRAGCV